ncbi:IgGFc-binding protein, partial [Pontibacter sp. Tf4]|uniref:IgGFc-binding protein n=1 Tax=Pontibacter sp. Tf4 TaxID=2761620 RepID=UPI001624508F
MKTNLLPSTRFLGAAVTRKGYLLNLILFLLPYLAVAQQPYLTGTDFWFICRSESNTDGPTLYVSSAYATTVKVELPATGHVTRFSVAAGETKAFLMTYFYGGGTSGSIHNEGVHVTSEKPVELLISIPSEEYRKHATQLYPTAILGYEYFTLNQELRYQYPGASGGSYEILAVEDNTLVEVTATFSNDLNLPAHQPFTLRMMAGDRYTMHSGEVDATGSKVRSISDGKHGRKRIAVFANSRNMSPNRTPIRQVDSYHQQLFPVRLWGQEYVSAPLMNSGVRHTYKVVAAYCNTKVSINNAAPVTIGAGEFIQFDSETACHIVADKPIAVAQYFHRDWDETKGEPETVMLAPVEQGVTEATITSKSLVNIHEHFINVVIPTAQAASFRLDGAPIAFSPMPSNPAL